MVQRRPKSAPRRNVVPGLLPTLQPWYKTRLGVLRLVLRAWIRRRFVAPIHRSALCRPLPQSEVRAYRPDAIHAILSVVPHEGTAKMEDRPQQRHVWQMRLRRAPRILDALSLVHSGP